jgi:hypothetical protein
MLKDISISVIKDYSAFILSYFIIDLCLYNFSNRPNKYIFITHHLTAIKIISLHLTGILPIDLGIYYLFMFEVSNSFLLFFQLFNEKQWITLRNITIIPFVLTYVPLRLIIIPLYSLNYNEIIKNMDDKFMAIYCFTLLWFINLFSMYYACVVVKKTLQFVSNIFV